MKMKTRGLQGAALDWAVAMCEGVKLMGAHGFVRDSYDNEVLFEPSTDWAQGGPIIEREKIGLDYYPDGGQAWGALCDGGNHESFGPTPLIAAMRCFVASKLGDEVTIPEEVR